MRRLLPFSSPTTPNPTDQLQLRERSNGRFIPVPGTGTVSRCDASSPKEGEVGNRKLKIPTRPPSTITYPPRSGRLEEVAKISHPWWRTFTKLCCAFHHAEERPILPYIMLGGNDSKDAVAGANDLKKDGKKTRSKFQQDLLRLPKEIRNIAAGGFAGMVAKSVVAPFDRIKILYQISSAEFHIYKVPGVAMNIVRTEGWTALWKGNTATMIRVFPYSGIQFMVFDRCKTFLLREQELDYVRRKAMDRTTKRPHWGLSPTESLVSGMIAGVVSVSMTYPLDLTRA
jgi:hypothetical protein